MDASAAACAQNWLATPRCGSQPARRSPCTAVPMMQRARAPVARRFAARASSASSAPASEQPPRASLAMPKPTAAPQPRARDGMDILDERLGASACYADGVSPRGPESHGCRFRRSFGVQSYDEKAFARAQRRRVTGRGVPDTAPRPAWKQSAAHSSGPASRMIAQMLKLLTCFARDASHGKKACAGDRSAKKGLRCRISPTCTLSQNGYGAPLLVARRLLLNRLGHAAPSAPNRPTPPPLRPRRAWSSPLGGIESRLLAATFGIFIFPR